MAQDFSLAANKSKHADDTPSLLMIFCTTISFADDLILLSILLRLRPDVAHIAHDLIIYVDRFTVVSTCLLTI